MIPLMGSRRELGGKRNRKKKNYGSIGQSVSRISICHEQSTKYHTMLLIMPHVDWNKDKPVALIV